MSRRFQVWSVRWLLLGVIVAVVVGSSLGASAQPAADEKPVQPPPQGAQPAAPGPAAEPAAQPGDVATQAAPPQPDVAATTPAVPPAAEATLPPSLASPPEKASESAASKAAPAVATTDAAASRPSTSDTSDASVLADAGYPLTPGVSAAPIRSDFVLSGFLQGQYESHQDSVDQLRQGGTPLNQDRFVLRRGRIKVSHDWDWAQIIVELDGNTVRGPSMRLQKAEASLIYGRSTSKDQPPIAQLTVGQFDLPFGFEMTYVPKVRWFTERTTASRAFFPGEPDVGARVSGGIAFARYSVAVTNGEPLDEKSGLGLQDPNANKDVTARLGAETELSKTVVIAGGVSFNRGKGFHAGTDATKNTVGWRDMNENGNVDPGEIVGLAGSAAVRSKDFGRWAVGADAELLLKTDLGWSMLYGELTAASNLDRGLLIADPVINGSAMRELGYYVAFTQEVTKYGVVGFRYETYDPNADFFDKRANKLLPASQQMHTYSPLAGLVLPGRARLVFQWDIVRDFLARTSSGVPTDFKNDQWTLRLQVML